MTLGPNKILKTPVTKSLVKVETLGSGNTFGAKWWSDGKMEAPMLPDSPWLRRHPATGEVFWCDECEVITSEETGGETSQYAQVPHAGSARQGDYLTLLDGSDLSLEKERYLRIRLWWEWNDPARRGKCPERPANFTSHLERLIEVVGHEKEFSRVMSAEALRQIGKHEGAAELLDFDFTDRYQSTAKMIRAANDQKQTDLFEIV